MIKEKQKKFNNPGEISDNELVKIVREKDQELFREIINRYQTRLFVYIFRLIRNREEAEDILQDVFLKTYRNLNSFDAERKFSSWIYRIAHNETVNYIKRKSIKRFISWEDVSSAKDKLDISDLNLENGAEEEWTKKEISQEVSQALKKLPLKYEQVLNLRYYFDKSYEEISEILGKPVNTVGTLIKRAKDKLASELKDNKKL